ncbi:MAG: ATP-binding protein [Pyrinomonadaceae bacterium]
MPSTRGSDVRRGADLKLFVFFGVIAVLVIGMIILAFGKNWGIPHRMGFIFLLSTAVNLIEVTELIRLVRRQQLKLGASEDRYRALFEHASDGIGVVTASDFRLIEINHKFSVILGYEPEELLGRDIRDLLRGALADGRQSLPLDSLFGPEPQSILHPAKHDLKKINRCPFRRVIKELAERPSSFVVSSEIPTGSSEMTINTSTGTPLPVSLSFTRLLTDRESLIILSFRDLSESRRLEAEKQEMQRQLFQTSKLASIGELSAGVAHEINNPLNCIINFAQLLKDEPGALSETERRSIDGIIEEGGRITKIVRDLLAFARRDSHELTRVPIEETIETSASLFGHQLAKDGITVEIDVDENLPAVRADGSRLRQVIVNMMSNAHHALRMSARESKLLRITARAVMREGRQVVRVEFFDTGMGIRQENIDKIFDPFFTTRRDSGGTGLGLSLSFGIVRDYGGTITVESEEGGYTRFTVELPAVEAPESEYAESFAGGR